MYFLVKISAVVVNVTKKFNHNVKNHSKKIRLLEKKNCRSYRFGDKKPQMIISYVICNFISWRKRPNFCFILKVKLQMCSWDRNSWSGINSPSKSVCILFVILVIYLIFCYSLESNQKINLANFDFF